MQTYPKRRFENVAEIAGEIAFLVRHRDLVAELATGRGQISPEFRERIMLAVTSVNVCRYCSFMHTLLARKEGLPSEEVRELLEGAVGPAPDEETEALLFAQHWAETRGVPELEARQKLVDTYGEDKARAIEVAIRAIMFGNYTGNTLDALLFTLSRGRLAKP